MASYRDDVDELNDWDPMAQDYGNPDFNRYRSGPGRRLPPGSSNNHLDSSAGTIRKHALVVKCLPLNFKDASLCHLFNDYGCVTEACMCQPRGSKQWTYGFVEFSNAQEAEYARRELNGVTLHDNCPPLNINYYVERDKSEQNCQQDSSAHTQSQANKYQERKVEGKKNELFVEQKPNTQRRQKFQPSGRSSQDHETMNPASCPQTHQSNENESGQVIRQENDIPASCPQTHQSNENESGQVIRQENDIPELLSIYNCAYCFHPGNKKCAVCKITLYCSRECQQRDWASHKRVCKRPEKEAVDYSVKPVRMNSEKLQNYFRDNCSQSSHSSETSSETRGSGHAKFRQYDDENVDLRRFNRRNRYATDETLKKDAAVNTDDERQTEHSNNQIKDAPRQWMDHFSNFKNDHGQQNETIPKLEVNKSTKDVSVNIKQHKFKQNQQAAANNQTKSEQSHLKSPNKATGKFDNQRKAGNHERKFNQGFRHNHKQTNTDASEYNNDAGSHASKSSFINRQDCSGNSRNTTPKQVVGDSANHKLKADVPSLMDSGIVEKTKYLKMMQSKNVAVSRNGKVENSFQNTSKNQGPSNLRDTNENRLKNNSFNRVSTKSNKHSESRQPQTSVGNRSSSTTSKESEHAACETMKIYSVQDLKKLVLPFGRVQVNYVDGQPWSRFYVHLIDNVNIIKELHFNLQNHCNTIAKQHTAPERGQICAAQWNDRTWYRAKINDVNGEKVVVYFIDYGNSSEVGRSDLRLLSDSLMKSSAQAILCKIAYVIPINDNWSQRANQLFIEKVCRKYCFVEFVMKEGSINTVRMFDQREGGQDFAKMLAGVGLAELDVGNDEEDCTVPQNRRNVSEVVVDVPINSPGATNSANVCENYDILDKISVGSVMYSSVFLHTDDVGTINSFWIMLGLPELQEYFEVVNNLTAVCDSQATDVSFTPAVGDIIAAQFGYDECWYRARVNWKNEHRYFVLYIDFGNYAEVVNVRRLTPEFRKIPPLALHCTLIGDAALKTSDVENPLFTITVLSKTKSQFVSEVKFDSVEQSFKVVSSPVFYHVKEVPSVTHALKKDFECKVFILSAENAKNVYVTLVQTFPMLDKFQQELNERCVSLDKGDYRADIGEVIAAKFSDDCWYRASVLSLEEVERRISYTVQFIDYGNQEIVDGSKIRQIPIEFILEKPKFAIGVEVDGAPELTCIEQLYYMEKLLNPLSPIPMSMKVLGNEDDAIVVSLFDEKGGELLVKQLNNFMTSQPKSEANEIIKEDKSTCSLASINRSTDGRESIHSSKNDARRMNSVNEAGGGDIAKVFARNVPALQQQEVDDKMPALLSVSDVSTEDETSLPSGGVDKRIGDFSENTVPVAADPITFLYRYSDCHHIDLPIGQTINVLMLSAEHPDLIFCTPIDEEVSVFETPAFTEMTQEINEYCGGLVDTCYTPIVSEVCYARYSEDGTWYRATVLYINNDKNFHVIFIDYGNMEIVPSKDIRKLHKPDFLKIPCVACHCKLSGVKPLDDNEGFPKSVAECMQLIVPMFSRSEITVQSNEYDAYYLIDVPDLKEKLLKDKITVEC